MEEKTMKPENLDAATVLELERNLNTMKELDNIKQPIEARVYSKNQDWTYRNDAYRKMVSEMDLKAKSELEVIVKEHKNKK